MFVPDVHELPHHYAPSGEVEDDFADGCPFAPPGAESCSVDDPPCICLDGIAEQLD